MVQSYCNGVLVGMSIAVFSEALLRTVSIFSLIVGLVGDCGAMLCLSAIC
jgi:hypothetical protein